MASAADERPPHGSPRPEQTFFSDPVLDRIMGVTLALASEVYVLRSHVRELERALLASGIALSPRTRLSPAELETERRDAEAFVAHLLQPTLGEQQARGAP